MFETLETPVRLWRVAGISLLLHGLLVCLLAVVRIPLPAAVVLVQRSTVFLALPPRPKPVPLDLAVAPKHRRPPIRFSFPAAHPRAAIPDLPPHPVLRAEADTVVRAQPALLPAPEPPLLPLPPIAAKPVLPVRTGVFSSNRTAEPLAARRSTRPTTGAFEAAGTPGPVGTGRTLSDSIAAGGAGFGDASGGPTANGSGAWRRAAVRNAGFEEVVTGPAPAARPPLPAQRNLTTGVKILFKPRPAYTESARQRRIEGEVLLEVLFTASGEVRVLRVLRGLEEGLDESAIQAARQIRFEAARRDGRPADSTATVHITFQLAY